AVQPLLAFLVACGLFASVLGLLALAGPGLDIEQSEGRSRRAEYESAVHEETQNGILLLGGLLPRGRILALSALVVGLVVGLVGLVVVRRHLGRRGQRANQAHIRDRLTRRVVERRRVL